jgi:predicted DCC family thiol-disulfide oxidoreductase YuxK
MAPRRNLGLFWLIPQDDAWIEAFFWVFLLFAVFLTVGFLSRFSSVVVFVCLSSILRRNGYIIHSGDALLRATGFFLMFAPTDAALSIDRLLRIWRGREGLEKQLLWPWAQRMIQIQTSLMYFSTFAWKTIGSDWRDGTALYYTTRLIEFQRFPMPTLDNGIILKLATWSALVIEFSAGVLVWVRRLRYWVLLAGLCLHLSIEYSMNIALFQWVALASYVTFIDPADLTGAWSWVRRHFAGWLGAPADVTYDGNCIRTARLANVLRAVDVFARLNIRAGQGMDLHSSPVGSALLADQDPARLLICRRGSVYTGAKGMLAISRLVPLLWPLAPLSLMLGPPKQAFCVAKATK